MSQPYTHRMHGAKCRQWAEMGQVAHGLLVQVQKRGVVYCARIAEPWTTPTGLDCWTVESISPEVARFTVPVKQVRLCGACDCVCMVQKQAQFDNGVTPVFSHARVVAPRDSLNFENSPLSAAV